ncbi:MAG: 3-oxoacyl-ACP synthase III family protein [Nitrospiria bacterium]
MKTKITGTGVAFPKRAVPNSELSLRIGLSEEAIVRLTGIHTRYWVGEGESAATLAVEAAKSALNAAALSVDKIDLIIVSTTSPNMFFPSTACLVQRDLSARPIPAFDINASCSGFLYALSLGNNAIQTGSAKHVLLISSEVKSPFLDLDDSSTAALFGDGAGAVILSPGKTGIRTLQLYADGSRHQLIHLPAGGSRQPATHDSLEQGSHTMKMEGKALFRMAVRKMESALSDLSGECGFPLTEIDFFIFHQANLRILEALLKRKKIPLHKTEITIPRFGNTSSSSLPVALDSAIRQGRLKPGDKLILCAFGGGMTWGIALLDW